MPGKIGASNQPSAASFCGALGGVLDAINLYVAYPGD
jgi:hypothetical protein